MAYDPTKPQNGDATDADVVRNNSNELKALIDTQASLITSLQTEVAAIPQGPPGDKGDKGDSGDKGDKGDQGDPGPQGPVMSAVVVDAVNTLNPGDAASVSSSFDGTNVHLTLGIPRGNDGTPGEVSNVQLSDGLAAAIATAAANSSANSNGVGLIDTSGISDPVMLMLADKMNELITAQRR